MRWSIRDCLVWQCLSGGAQLAVRGGQCSCESKPLAQAHVRSLWGTVFTRSFLVHGFHTGLCAIMALRGPWQLLFPYHPPLAPNCPAAFGRWLGTKSNRKPPLGGGGDGGGFLRTWQPALLVACCRTGALCEYYEQNLPSFLASVWMSGDPSPLFGLLSRELVRIKKKKKFWGT